MKKVIITMCIITISFSFGITAFFIARRPSPKTISFTTLTSAPLSELHIDNNGRLNINLATAQELTVLNGIGDVLAQRIVEYREVNGPFHDVSELLNISGIGPVKLENIINQIYIG